MDINSFLIGVISLLPLLLVRFKNKLLLFFVAAISAIIINGVYLFGPNIIYLLITTYIVSTIAELYSLKSGGGIFGARYSYNLNHIVFSSRLNLLKIYPIEVSFAWVILKYMSFNMALIITTAFDLPAVVFILLTPLILVSLDFILDPYAVNTLKLWKWEIGSKYFGIPIQNFVGWYLVGLVSTLLFHFIYGSIHITFNILFALPVILYGTFIIYSKDMFKSNKNFTILGILPMVLWVLLSGIGLVLLYFK
jgi:uncharacterized membrane protein